MIKSQSIFIKILNSALRNLPMEETADIQSLTLTEWQELIDMAQAHKVLPMFYDVVYKLPAFQKQDVVFKDSLRRNILQQLSLQTIRTTEFLRLNKAWQELGIKPIVVKGLVCRYIYPKLDSRVSSDEDVLVAPESYEAAKKLIEDFGYLMEDKEDRAADEYEITYSTPDKLMRIELHRELFDATNASYGDAVEFFKNVSDKAIEMQIEGERVFTLAPTDHLLFLICHAFKHFIFSGCGIRQLCDILMLAEYFGEQIDWAYIIKACRKLSLELFAVAVFKIGSRHLSFDEKKAHYPDEWSLTDIDEMPMFEDVLNAGVFGVTTLSRGHSGRITLNAVAAKKQGKSEKSSVLRSLFPSARSLRQHYPYLTKRPFLVPVAWLCRIVKYGLELIKTKDNSTMESIKIGQQRVELLKFYGVIEK